MKTLTEFDGFRLKNALAKKAELSAAGKTPEELPAAMGEVLKLEGDKLTLFLAALEHAEKRAEGLKRIVVFTVEEGKKAPHGAVQVGDKWFLAEFFYTPAPKRESKHSDRDGGKRGRGKRGKGRGGRDRNARGPRPEGAPASTNEGAAQAAGDSTGEQGEKRRRRRRPPRGPRAPGAGTGANANASASTGSKPNVKPNVVPNPTPVKTETPAS